MPLPSSSTSPSSDGPPPLPTLKPPTLSLFFADPIPCTCTATCLPSRRSSQTDPSPLPLDPPTTAPCPCRAFLSHQWIAKKCRDCGHERAAHAIPEEAVGEGGGEANYAHVSTTIISNPTSPSVTQRQTPPTLAIPLSPPQPSTPPMPPVSPLVGAALSPGVSRTPPAPTRKPPSSPGPRPRPRPVVVGPGTLTPTSSTSPAPPITPSVPPTPISPLHSSSSPPPSASTDTPTFQPSLADYRALHSLYTLQCQAREAAQAELAEVQRLTGESGGAEVVRTRSLLAEISRLSREVEELRAEVKRRREDSDRVQEERRREQAEREQLQAEVRRLMQSSGTPAGLATSGEEDRWADAVAGGGRSPPVSPRNAVRALPMTGMNTGTALAMGSAPSSEVSSPTAAPSQATVHPPPMPPPRRPVSGTVLTTLPINATAALPMASTAPIPSLPPRPSTFAVLPSPAAAPPPSNYFSAALPPMPHPLTLESVLSYFHSTHRLSDAHLQYLVPFVEEAMEQSPSAAALLSVLRQMECELVECEYTLEQKIGAGGFGEVYEGRRRKDGERVAIKVVDLEMSTEDVSTISQEVLSLSSTRSCPQLISYYGCTVVHTHSLWLAMELVQDGSLLSHLQRHGPFNEDLIAIITQQVLMGLQYMASEGKIHRDIKAANILVHIQKSKIVLTDFGASRQLSDTLRKCNTLIGSPYWMAPEVLLRDDYDGKADVWSLGITLYELAIGKPPNAHIPPMQVMQKIVDAPSPSLSALTSQAKGIGEGMGSGKGREFSANFVHFVSLCLVKDPAMRPSVGALLKHEFVRKAKALSKLKGMFVERERYGK